MEYSSKAEWAVRHIDLPKASMVEDAEWEQFQIDLLNNDAIFGIDNKSRQIAWSFTAAVDAVVDAIFYPGHPHVFVSINKEESAQKIRYVENIVLAIDSPNPPIITKLSTTQIEFANGSRFVSHPQRPVRGAPQARIYLDEMAHYLEGMDQKIYFGSLPAIVKGGGYIRIGSSPLGARGTFWEIFTESIRPYPDYVRNRIPWWEVRSMCIDVPRALRDAPGMLTDERVETFGKPALQELRDNMFEEDFQQEFECAWVDEATAWISWAMIKKNQDSNLLHWHAKSVDQAIGMIDELNQAILDGKIERVMVGGIDIGRKHNLTEFMALGVGTTDQIPIRFMVSLDRVEFDDQERCFVEIINRLPFTRVLIDQNGLGMQLAENVSRITGKAEGVDFTNPSKELWAVEARIQAERGNVPLPVDRAIAYQIHSIKKKITAAKNNVFDTEKNEKHHADKFWAWALAISAASNQGAGLSEWESVGKVEDYESKWR